MLKKYLGVLKTTSGFRAVVRFLKWAWLISQMTLRHTKIENPRFPKKFHILFSMDDPIANISLYVLGRPKVNFRYTFKSTF